MPNSGCVWPHIIIVDKTVTDYCWSSRGRRHIVVAAETCITIWNKSSNSTPSSYDRSTTCVCMAGTKYHIVCTSIYPNSYTTTEITSGYATWFTAGGAIRIALRQLLQNRKLRHLWRHNLGSRWKLQKLARENFSIGAFYNITKNQDNPIKTVRRESFLSPKTP